MMTPARIFYETQVELLRMLAAHVKQRPDGQLHYTDIEKLAEELAKKVPPQ
jgi:hypothetical protein